MNILAFTEYRKPYLRNIGCGLDLQLRSEAVDVIGSLVNSVVEDDSIEFRVLCNYHMQVEFLVPSAGRGRVIDQIEEFAYKRKVDTARHSTDVNDDV